MHTRELSWGESYVDNVTFEFGYISIRYRYPSRDKIENERLRAPGTPAKAIPNHFIPISLIQEHPLWQCRCMLHLRLELGRTAHSEVFWCFEVLANWSAIPKPHLTKQGAHTSITKFSNSGWDNCPPAPWHSHHTECPWTVWRQRHRQR